MRKLYVCFVAGMLLLQAGCYNVFSKDGEKNAAQETATVLLAAGGLTAVVPQVSVAGARDNWVIRSGFLTGTATGGPAVAAVQVSLNGGPYEAAEGTAEWRYRLPVGGPVGAIGVRAVNADSETVAEAAHAARRGVNCDVNGDGYQDMAVGAPGYNGKQGRVYVYHGGPSGIGTSPSKVLTGANVSDYFGVSLALGDVNGDGYADCVVGASGYNSKTGRFYIYFGSADGIDSINSPASQYRDGDAAAESFGGPMALGDVNGDGYEDVALGAPQYSTNYGRAYVYHGSSSGIAASAARVLTGSSGSSFGGKLVIGDTNGDGYADLAVAAPTTARGAVYVYHGGASGIGAAASVSLAGENSGDAFGFNLTMGDSNGDGCAELVAAAPYYNSASGRVYIYSGGPAGIDSISAPVHVDAEGVSNFLGSAMTMDDVSGDGYCDLAVDAAGYDSMAGRVYVHHGSGTGLTVAPSRVLTGAAANVWFGYSVALGDINGDGYADLAAGTPTPDTNTGFVEIFHGSSAGIGSSSSRTLTGAGENYFFGYSVSMGNIESDDWWAIAY